MEVNLPAKSRNHRLQKRLQTVIGGRTLLLVTHRLSMLRIVDRLIVMENGQIKLDGPRDVVLQNLRERSQKNMGNAEQAARQANAGQAHEDAASA